MPIISELVAAYAYQWRAQIAILTPRDRVQMEGEIRVASRDTGRTGRPMETASLDLMSLDTTKSVIVLSPDGDDPDSAVINALLVITNGPARSEDRLHTVTAVRNRAHMDVARLAGGEEAELVLIGDVIACIAAQTCRQSGLPIVYIELLSLAGGDLTFQREPGLVGSSFGDVLLAAGNSAVPGICPSGGPPLVNPRMDALIKQRDQLIAISEDDDTIVRSGLADLGICESSVSEPQPREPAPEHVLVPGRNWRAPVVVGQLDKYVAPGLEGTVVAGMADREGDVALHRRSMPDLSSNVRAGQATDRRVLESLPPDSADRVVLLAYSDVLDPQDTDARMLITLLHLRDIPGTRGHSFSIVSEMMDSRNTELAQVARADGYILSDRVVSLNLSHIAESKLPGAGSGSPLQSSRLRDLPASRKSVCGSERSLRLLHRGRLQSPSGRARAGLSCARRRWQSHAAARRHPESRQVHPRHVPGGRQGQRSGGEVGPVSRLCNRPACSSAHVPGRGRLTRRPSAKVGGGTCRC